MPGRFILRRDIERAKIEEAARANQRSMTGEIIARLEKSFRDDDAFVDLERRVTALEARDSDGEG